MSNKTLITGGAGFIGSNYADHLLERGEEVILFDNLSRKGSKKNLEWLEKTFGKKSFHFVNKDIRNSHAVEEVVRSADVVIHLAAQVAVTNSVTDPREDFEINALGTFNVLEAARKSGHQPIIIFASTNKVYGGMEDLIINEELTRYQLAEFPNGIDEMRNLNFHSPYGCSKGCGDQYVRDYARIYQIPSVVFRQSCIYGKRQFGVEDQGWVAWFVIAAFLGKTISIYGDGKQVRDLLFVDDLLNAYDLAVKKIKQTAGQVFNIGGGIGNSISIWREFQPILENIQQKKISWKKFDWRPGDQKIYVSDTGKFETATDWKASVSVLAGIQELVQWVLENPELFRDFA
jgi:CDP-paratose 2-epimerase